MASPKDRPPRGSDDTLSTVRDMRPLVDESPPPRRPRAPTGDSSGGDFAERTEVGDDVARAPGAERETVRQFRISVIEGPQSGLSWESAADRCSIGSHNLNDVVLDDATVSRFHCELRVEPDGVVVHDLRSLNHTLVDGLRVKEAYLKGGSVLRLGRAVVRFEFGTEQNRLPVSEKLRFGGLVGQSLVMRQAFAVLERAAATDATVLIEGETGSGKGATAEAIHRQSKRAAGPFITVDCSAIPANLLESELFGHEKGAFTGADARRIGAFEEASGGTVFLDEIGELPLDLQPKLLRVLESREIRRVGTNAHKKVDVRLIAATNRDLRAEVNAQRFRSDLYYRLAVVKVTLPSLRQRLDDLPVLVEHMLGGLGADADARRQLLAPEFIAQLGSAPWSGNIRELRNYLERCLVFREALPVGEGDGALATAAARPGGAAQPARAIDAHQPFADARKHAIDAFERGYLEALLALHQGKVAAAATGAQLDRVYLYRLLRKHGLGKK